MTSATTITSPILTNILTGQKPTIQDISKAPKNQQKEYQDVFIKNKPKKEKNNKNDIIVALINAGSSIGSMALLIFGVSRLFSNIKKGGMPGVSPAKTNAMWENISSALKIKDMNLSEETSGIFSRILKNIQNPQAIKEKGGKSIKTILLYGPPGTGKTTLAKAVAKEFPNSEFANLDVTRLGSKYVGETEKNIQAAVEEICEKAKLNPEKKYFVFIDEIDSVMMVDTGSAKKHSNDVLNEFKRCFTEKLGKHDNIITIGATNVSIDAEAGRTIDGKLLDKPMLDRFQEKILVDLPTKGQIRDFFVSHYQNAKMVSEELKNKDSEKLNIICEFLSNKKRNVSFRTLDAIFNDAASRGDINTNTSIEDIFYTLKSKQKELKITDQELKNLATSLNISQ